MLAHVLGEVPGFVSVGELRLLWQRAVLENERCGCGTRFSRCPFWVDVLDLVYGPTSTPQRVALAARWHSEIEVRTRVWTLPRHLRGTAAERYVAPDEVSDVLERLYSAIATVSGADVVVDSSKRPTYAALLHDLPELDVRVTHFLRDPRASVYSGARRPASGTAATLAPARGAAGRHALRWAVWNRSLELLGNRRLRSYTRVTYEDFLADPQHHTELLLEALDLPADLRPVFAAPGIIRVGVQHTVNGNQLPPLHGLVALAPDLEWQQRMKTSARSTVSALTWPTRRRYGYRLRR
jgi:hypothetical protein